MSNTNLGMREHAQSLLKQDRNGKASAPSTHKAPTPFAHGSDRKLYHPQVYAKISQHIKERLSKLGG